MRNYGFLFLAGILLALAACAPQTQPAPAPPPVAKPDFQPTSTIREIMQSMVMPQADVIWGAVSIEVGPKGEIANGPKTEEDWAKLRRQAVTMAEASNLILMDGRQVAAPGDKGNKDSDPNALPPEKIQALIDGDKANWTKFSHELHAAALNVIKAVDVRKSEGVSDAGNDLNTSCENCHKQYWYPPKAGASAEKPAAGSEAPKEAPKKDDKK